jgi:predicted amidohydrolase
MNLADPENPRARGIDPMQSPERLQRPVVELPFAPLATRRSRILVCVAPLFAAACIPEPGVAVGSTDTTEDGTTGAPEPAPTSSGELEPEDTTGSSSSTSTSTSSDESSSSGSSAGEERPPPPPSIALVQYDADAHFGDYDFNLASLTMWAEAAVAQGAKVIVFPEGSTYGYETETERWCKPGFDMSGGKSCRDVSTVAEALPGGPTTVYWAAFAAEHGVAVVYHVPERSGEKFFSSLGVVDPGGYVTRYRRRALSKSDWSYMSKGYESTLLDTPWGVFGLMLTLDGEADGAYYEEYLDDGVDGIILPMHWNFDPVASAYFQERAANNDVRIYAADGSTGDGTGLYLPGDVPRVRDGLPPVALGIDGLSVHELGE